ncbi:MAG: hypothetical protein HY816_19110 [Candidatus Wallbacteria bacterium]|nr:hypothetical protein [Candidatus Wallbacteria bacterium]
MQAILFSGELDQETLPRVGGKGRNLWLLDRFGMRVPAWFALSSELFSELVLEDPEVRSVWRRWRRQGAATRAEPGERAAVSRALSARARAVPLSDGFESDLSEALDRLARLAGCASSELVVSVRSSASAEDAAGRSFAGQFTSQLFVRGAAAVSAAVRDCWASAFGEGVLAYAAGAGDTEPAAMAVLVQQMVPGEVSGVAFSVDPVTEDFDTVVISAGYGTCDGIVGDRVGTDLYRVSEGGRRFEAKLGPKSERMAAADGGGTRAVDVEAAEAARPALDEPRARELAALVRDVERRYGVAVDLEWTLSGGQFWLLQARPITTLARKDPRCAPKLLWDNSNIVESYSGVTSPLTFTFASSGYSVIYRQFGKLVGDSEAFLEAHKRELANMLGLQKGRVYYNLLNWYLALYYFPGFRFNKSAMEQMMGVKESLDFQVPMGPMTLSEKLWEAGAFVWAVARVLWNSFRVDARVRDFQENFERVYGAHAGLDLSRMQVPAILSMAEKVRESLMLRWTAPILTDCLAMMFMKLLRVATAAWIGGDRPGLENDLLSGEGGIDSTRPTKTLVALAARVRQDARARELFATLPEPALRATVESDPALAWLAAEIERFRLEFGFRCIGELKLELDSIKEDPSFVYSMLKNYARQDGLDLGRMEARERATRAGAEEFARANVRPGGWLGRAGRWALFDWVLGGARKHVKNRENMRFARTRIFGFFREVFNAVGLKLFAAGLIDHPKDVYYLTIDELHAFAEGRAVTQDIRSLARLRYAEYRRFRRENVPDRFSTHGVVYAPGNQRPDAPAPGAAQPAATAGADGSVLQGVSACPGIVRGRVRVIRDASDDLSLDGQILAAPRTDPGWVPLFPSASGLLIESGSILSHSAIVARELGIPAIVGLKGLLERVTDGQEVLMDAGKGTVQLAPEPAPPAPAAGLPPVGLASPPESSRTGAPGPS